MTDTYVISNTGKASITKDPDAVLDYSWDWTDWLADIGDTIASHEILTALVEKDSSTDDGHIVTAILSGGALGKTGTATCRITTAAGRVDDRTIYLKIRAR